MLIQALSLISALMGVFRTLPVAVSTGSAVVAGSAFLTKPSLDTVDMIVMACGAVGAAAQFIQTALSQRREGQL